MGGVTDTVTAPGELVDAIPDAGFTASHGAPSLVSAETWKAAGVDELVKIRTCCEPVLEVKYNPAGDGSGTAGEEAG